MRFSDQDHDKLKDENKKLRKRNMHLIDQYNVMLSQFMAILYSRMGYTSEEIEEFKNEKLAEIGIRAGGKR